MIEKTNIPHENDSSSRRAKVANWIKQIIIPVSVKVQEAAHEFVNTYLYTRYMLNTGVVSYVLVMAKEGANSVINNTEFGREPTSQEFIVNLPSASPDSSNTIEAENEQELVA